MPRLPRRLAKVPSKMYSGESSRGGVLGAAHVLHVVLQFHAHRVAVIVRAHLQPAGRAFTGVMASVNGLEGPVPLRP